MNLTMIGAGYVGLVTGACLADFGHDVTCVDTDRARLDALNAGRIPIYEPGLERIVASNRMARRLIFSTDVAKAIASADAVFICVGTPADPHHGRAELSYVRAAAQTIAAAMADRILVVIKSTVPVGTGDEVERIIRTARPAAKVAVVSNPEFLREGAAIEDFKHPNRIVVGTTDEAARATMTEIYRPLFLNQSPMLFTDRRTAELVKYASNAFLATKITFINEIADLCERVGADVQDVARGMGLDNRIGPKFLHPGPGFGGSCFPKDTLALAGTARDAGVRLRIVDAVVSANNARKDAMAHRVIEALGGSATGRTVAILGLTFKPNTDDMREAPSLAIVAGLRAAGATIRAYDPEGTEAARAVLGESVSYATDPYDCATGADALVIVTEWEAFRALDLSRLKSALAQPLIVDLRNVYRPSDVISRGLAYRSIGRRARDLGEKPA
ncbi:MAG: UDP-glucose/GDP-mannose dehydrogenase family protein [Bauldia sp.]